MHDPRVAVRTAQVLIAECGLDMSRFPTVGHFASWAGICPGHHESAVHKKSGRTRPGPRWLTEALTESAKAAARSKGTYFAAHHAQLRGRRGEPRAIGALGTTSSSRTSTSSATRSRSASSDQTGKRSAPHQNTAPAGCNARSKRSATKSPWRKAKQQNKPPERPTTAPRSAVGVIAGTNGAARTWSQLGDSQVSGGLVREGGRRAVGEAYSLIAAEKTNFPSL